MVSATISPHVFADVSYPLISLIHPAFIPPEAHLRVFNLNHRTFEMEKTVCRAPEADAAQRHCDMSW